MHPDLSAHLHSDECNRLIQELFNCRAEHGVLKFFGICNTPYDKVLACLKGERLARRANNVKISSERQTKVRERVKNDKTDYEELLKQYRRETKP